MDRPKKLVVQSQNEKALSSSSVTYASQLRSATITVGPTWSVASMAPHKSWNCLMGRPLIRSETFDAKILASRYNHVKCSLII